MTERLPKECAPIIDALPKAFGKDFELGLGIGITSGGKNKFKLLVRTPCKQSSIGYAIWVLVVNYSIIHISGLSNILDKSLPDFVLKPKAFISIDDFASKFNVSKETLAKLVLKSLKSKMTSQWSWTHGEGVKIHGEHYI